MNEEKEPRTQREPDWNWARTFAHFGTGIGSLIVLVLIIFLLGGFDQIINKVWP